MTRAFLAFLAVALFSVAAWPCSLAEPSFHGPSAPADGADAVPLNTVLTLFTHTRPADLPPGVAELVNLDTDERTSLSMAFDFDTVLIDLAGTIEASTPYRVEFLRESSFNTGDADPEPGNGFGELRESISFTTADVADDEPPTVDATVEYTTEHFSLPPGTISSCGPVEDRWIAHVTVPAASDDQGLAGARLVLIDELGGRVEIDSAPYQDGMVLQHPAFEPGIDVYQVEVFDLAGNVAMTDEVEINRGGPLGCSSVHTGGGTPWGLGLLPFFLLFHRRRRS